MMQRGNGTSTIYATETAIFSKKAHRKAQHPVGSLSFDIACSRSMSELVSWHSDLRVCSSYTKRFRPLENTTSEDREGLLTE